MPRNNKWDQNWLHSRLTEVAHCIIASPALWSRAAATRGEADRPIDRSIEPELEIGDADPLLRDMKYYPFVQGVSLTMDSLQ